MPEPHLSIHTSNRLEVLAEHLAGVVAAEPLPPLVRESIVVQSQGMARWLTLELADRLAIAAGLTMPFPGTFCHDLAERLLDGRDAELSGKPPLFDREPSTWRIFDRLPDLVASGDGEASPAAYLRDDPDQLKRYQLAVRLAGLFESYQLFRPGMLLDWEEASGPAQEKTVPPHAGWQARLWRSLADGTEDHLARRSLRLLEVLRRSPSAPAGLPARLSIFGASTLPPIFLHLAAALARFVPVRIYVLSPTYHYWGDLRSEREAVHIRRRSEAARRGAPEEGGRRNIPGDDHLEPGHPLLATLGRQGRDFFNLLQEADTLGAAWHELDLVDPGDDTLLHALQSDLLHLEDRGAAGAEPRRLAAGDDSLTVHACHSKMREMEVLRDQLLAAFDRDPALEPSDVVVMVPRIADYSPYVEATFGVAWEGTPALPFAIADRQAGQERPASDTALRLLDLVGSRVAPGAVFDLLDSAAVRRAFGVAAGEVPALRRWVRDSRIRWGIDGTQRAADFRVPSEEANTWRAGLDRLLMGYAAGGIDELVAGVAPHAGSTAGDAELLGRLAAFTDTLFRHLRRLREPRPPDVWARDLKDALEDLHRAESEEEESALELVRGVLEELHQAREVAEVEEDLSRQVVRAHLGRRLAGDGSGSGFLGGRITFCSLAPMRALPFKVICVAGLAEGAFPRREPRYGFDLMAADRRPGDRSPAEDDRYLFLETLLAAGCRLILTYEGRSQKDNSPRAPSAVVAELLETLDRAFVTEDGRPAREQIVVEHALHPFSPAYFGAGEDPRLFSYSQEGARASRSTGRPASAAPFIDDEAPNSEDVLGAQASGRLRDADSLGAQAARRLRAAGGTPATDEPLDVELPELTALWVHPAKHYCRRVLQLTLTEGETSDEDEPFDVDFLDRYNISQWLLERRLEDAPAGALELQLLRQRGELPLAGLGAAHYARLARRVDDFAATLPRPEPRDPLLIDVAGHGWRLTGRLDQLTADGRLSFRCANLKPKDYVRAWIAHIARAAWEAVHPSGLPPVTHLAGIDRSVRFGPLEDPAALLDTLIAGYRAGLRRPLPLFENASHAYAEATHKTKAGGQVKTSPEGAARRTFTGGRFAGDAGDPYVKLCFRDRDPLAEDGFARWAEILWAPILEHAKEIE